MSHGPHELTTLSEEECRNLLRNTPIGRIVYTHGALPAALPVIFMLHEDHIVLRTAPGSTLDAALRNAVVAFEVDQIDLATHTGWSVLVVGHARHETNPRTVSRLDRLGLRSWTPHPRPRYVRIRCERVTGRLLDGQGPRPDHHLDQLGPDAV